MNTLECLHCSDWFRFNKKREPNRKYCSRKCYWAHRVELRSERMASGLKTCKRCKTEKPRTEFSPCGDNNPDGLHGWCKVCRCECEKARRVNPAVIKVHRNRYENDMDYRATSLIGAIKKRCRREG